MTTSTTTIATLDTVTAEQIARCERIIDMSTGRAFFLVQSESYDANFTEYKVEAIKKNGTYFVTCTCPAGQKAIACKHKRWAMAAARIEKMQARKQAETPVTVVLPESVPTLILDNEQADELTTRRVMNASVKPARKGKGRTDTKAFSLLGR